MWEAVENAELGEGLENILGFDLGKDHIYILVLEADAAAPTWCWLICPFPISVLHVSKRHVARVEHTGSPQTGLAFSPQDSVDAGTALNGEKRKATSRERRTGTAENGRSRKIATLRRRGLKWSRLTRSFSSRNYSRWAHTVPTTVDYESGPVVEQVESQRLQGIRAGETLGVVRKSCPQKPSSVSAMYPIRHRHHQLAGYTLNLLLLRRRRSVSLMHRLLRSSFWLSQVA